MRLRVLIGITIFAVAMGTCAFPRLNKNMAAVASIRPQIDKLSLPLLSRHALQRAKLDQASAKLFQAEQKLANDDCSFESLPGTTGRSSAKYLEILRCPGELNSEKLAELSFDLHGFVEAAHAVVDIDFDGVDANLLNGKIRSAQHVLEQIEPARPQEEGIFEEPYSSQTIDLIHDIARKTGYWVVPGGANKEERNIALKGLEKFKEMMRSASITKLIGHKDIDLIYLAKPTNVRQMNIEMDSDRTYIIINPDLPISEMTRQLAAQPRVDDLTSKQRHERMQKEKDLIHKLLVQTHSQFVCRIYPEMSLSACLQGLQTAETAISGAHGLKTFSPFIDISDKSEKSPSGHIYLGFGSSPDQMIGLLSNL